MNNNILAIDTTTKNTSVSIEYNKCIFTKQLENNITHSEKLLKLIDQVISNSNCLLKDMNYLGCVIGPGSFTGIRIGLSTIKAFSTVHNLKIFGISSLEIMAYMRYLENDEKDGIYTSVIDAKNSRAYFNAFNISSTKNIVTIKAMYDDINIPINDIEENLLNISNEIIFGISNNIDYVNTLNKNLQNHFILGYPNSSHIIQLFNNTDITKYLYDYISLDAKYSRMSQAERVKLDGESK